MKALLSQALIDKLRKDGARAEVWDSKLANFFLQVRPSGAATFYIRYLPTGEEGGSKRQSFRVGDAAVLSVGQARTMAQGLLARVALGHNPMEEKRQSRACPSLAEVVEEHYLPHIKQTKKSWDTDETMLRCHILPV